MKKNNTTNSFSLTDFKEKLTNNLQVKSKQKKRNITFYVSEESITKIEQLSKEFNVSKSTLIETLLETTELV